VQTALRELLLQGTLANVLLSTLGDDATLYELAVLISEPGSPRQPVHPDNPHQEHPPLLTCFVALQDIHSSMGPTTFIPKTNTAAAHAEFDDIGQRDAMLEKRPNVAALLNAGDASLFDSRTMHCGGANDVHEGATRALLYVSFRNPRATMPIGNVGSIMSDIKPISLRELRTKLGALSDGDPFDDEEEEAGAVDKYRLDAAQGHADAQFNLGLCYRRGEGVEKNDAEAVRWFRLAAEQCSALAQCNLGFSYYLGEGVEKSEVEAFRWFGLAAAQGLAHAQHNLGFCYSSGVGVPRDLERAAELFKLAAEQGHPGAEVAYAEVLDDMQS
jgi:TPR repeat protein